MVTLSKPAAGDTDWATEINDNWTALEGSVNTLEGDVSTLQGDVSTLDGRVDVLFSEVTLSQVTANQAVIAPTLQAFRTLVRVDANGDYLIRSLDNPLPNLEVTFAYFGSTGSLTFTHEDTDGSVTATERFVNRDSADQTLEPGDSITYRYDDTSDRWRQIG